MGMAAIEEAEVQIWTWNWTRTATTPSTPRSPTFPSVAAALEKPCWAPPNRPPSPGDRRRPHAGSARRRRRDADEAPRDPRGRRGDDVQETSTPEREDLDAAELDPKLAGIGLAALGFRGVGWARPACKSILGETGHATENHRRRARGPDAHRRRRPRRGLRHRAAVGSTVNAPADKAWPKINGYCQIGAWFKTTCELTSGKDHEMGAVRLIAGRVTELFVSETAWSYTYSQPKSPIDYHGTVEIQLIDKKTSKLPSTPWSMTLRRAAEAMSREDKGQGQGQPHQAVHRPDQRHEGGGRSQVRARCPDSEVRNRFSRLRRTNFEIDKATGKLVSPSVLLGRRSSLGASPKQGELQIRHRPSAAPGR